MQPGVRSSIHSFRTDKSSLCPRIHHKQESGKNTVWDRSSGPIEEMQEIVSDRTHCGHLDFGCSLKKTKEENSVGKCSVAHCFLE